MLLSLAYAAPCHALLAIIDAASFAATPLPNADDYQTTF